MNTALPTIDELPGMPAPTGRRTSGYIGAAKRALPRKRGRPPTPSAEAQRAIRAERASVLRTEGLAVLRDALARVERGDQVSISDRGLFLLGRLSSFVAAVRREAAKRAQARKEGWS